MLERRRAFVLCLSILALAVPAGLQAEAATAQQHLAEDPNLDAGIAAVREADFLRAIFLLNDAVAALSKRPDAAAMMARAHAYRAAAYVGLEQPARAMAAALLATRANPTIVVAAPEFSRAVVKLFADPAGFASSTPAESPAARDERAPAGSDAAPTGVERAVRPARAAEPAVVAPAMIYVYFPHAARGLGVNSKVTCDGQRMADLGNGRFIVLKAAPGFHHFEFKRQKAAASFEGGVNHYLRVGIEGYPAHFVLRITDPEQAAAEMRDKKVAPSDPGDVFSAECTSVAATPARKRF